MPLDVRISRQPGLPAPPERQPARFDSAGLRSVSRAALDQGQVGAAPVPTLVYGHGKHLISLTAVPAAGGANSAPALSDRGGYNIFRWTDDEVTYWAISDASALELEKFAELFRTTPPDQ